MLGLQLLGCSWTLLQVSLLMGRTPDGPPGHFRLLVCEGTGRDKRRQTQTEDCQHCWNPRKLAMGTGAVTFRHRSPSSQAHRLSSLTPCHRVMLLGKVLGDREL